MENNDKTLTLYDLESQTTYNLIVDSQDYFKALSDNTFATSLLLQAKCSQTNTEVTEENTDNTQFSTTDSDTEYLSDLSNINAGHLKTFYTWSYNQVVDLINSMSQHLEDLNHPRKRRHVFENVANDLISLKHEVNAIMVQNKWKNLVRTYKIAKENKTRTGRGPSRFQFFDAMDEILGTNPNNGCTHDINSSSCNNETAGLSVTRESGTDEPQGNDTTKVVKKTLGNINQKKLKNEYIEVKREEYLFDSSNINAGHLKTFHTWSYNQVVDLINSMSQHFKDLNHPRKRRHVFENIANDLISLKHEVNAIMVQNKWKNLVRSYKIAKDNKRLIGRGPSRFQFFDTMDEILGTNRTNGCTHSINSSSIDNAIVGPSVSRCSHSSNSSSCNNETAEPSVNRESDTDEPQGNDTTKVVNKTLGNISQKKLIKEYIELKRDEFAKRQKRHDDRIKLEQEKIALENRKLELLERYFQTNI